MTNVPHGSNPQTFKCVVSLVPGEMRKSFLRQEVLLVWGDVLSSYSPGLLASGSPLFLPAKLTRPSPACHHVQSGPFHTPLPMLFLLSTVNLPQPIPRSCMPFFHFFLFIDLQVSTAQKVTGFPRPLLHFICIVTIC